MRDRLCLSDVVRRDLSTSGRRVSGQRADGADRVRVPRGERGDRRERRRASRQSETDFVCECADPKCARRLTAGLDDYEEVRVGGDALPARARARRARDRACRRAAGGYEIVEKFGPVVTPIVRQLDPRAQRVAATGSRRRRRRPRRRRCDELAAAPERRSTAPSAPSRPRACARRPCSRC